MSFSERQLRRGIGLIVAVWSLAIAGSMVWSSRLLREAMVEAAVTTARENISKDLMYRRWATMHGGVYVPVTDVTPPSPYMASRAERDLVTPSGRRLTLMNPAYVTRQVHELETKELGTLAHLTSLKPLRPENAPDQWEAAALRAFEQGRAEVLSEELVGGRAYMRLMQPLVTEKGCLQCHGAQGYREGEIRGGLSVSVPLAPYLAVMRAQAWPIGGVHAGLWGLGVLGILLAGRQTRRRVDEQMEAEAALRRSETKFRALYDSTRDAVMVGDLNGFIDCNDETLRMFRCATVAEFCTKHAADLSPSVQPDGGESYVLANEHIRRAMETGVDKFEWTHSRADTGEPFPTEIVLSAMELDGKPVVQATVRDITERKLAEKKLRDLSRAVEQSPASIVVTDLDANIEYVNPKFVEITGYSAAEAAGQNPRVLKSGEKSPEEYRELWETISSGREWRGEFHNKKKNGDLFWESASISPIRDAAGRVTSYVAVKEDITARKRQEDELATNLRRLEHAEKLLRARNEELKGFAYTVSHDLKAPLRGIAGYAAELNRRHKDGLGERALFCIDQILTATRNLDGLIEDLLQYSRLDVDAPAITQVDLGAVFDSILKDRSAIIATQGVEVSLEIPAITLLIWERGLTQVLSNIIDNALKYSRHSQPPFVTITAAEERGSCRVTVADNGIGFDMKYHDRIFGLFNRLVRTDEFEGSGVGLAIVKKLIERLGGTVSAESAPGKGATFTVLLPMQPLTGSAT